MIGVIKIKKDKSKIKRNRLERLLDIPKEISTSEPKITIMGFNQLMVENYKGIIEYEDYLIKLNTFIGTLTIDGINLNLNQITEDDILINGQINNIYLESTEEEA